MRAYGSPSSGATPVVCLPGLARTAADFDALAQRLAVGGRFVAALDYRGRGLSDYDADWRNYSIAVENCDLRSLLDAAGIARAIFVGTSRGGLHVMALAAERPQLLAGAVLNDIGPVIEPAGLARIRSYVGKLPKPASWPDAAALFKGLFRAQFPAPEDRDWETYARGTLVEKDGELVPAYDPRLSLTLEEIAPRAPTPDAWALFDRLSGVPLLAIRGANSDLLSPATLEAMASRHPRCETLVVPGQGHAPLLLDEPTQSVIERFVAKIEPGP